MLEGWQKMAEVLSQYDVRYVMPTLIKVADQQMKITILKSRGVVDGLLAEMRQHMAEIFDVPSARLLPFCQGEDCKMLPCLVAAPAIYAAGARACRIISCHGGESLENAWGSACV